MVRDTVIVGCQQGVELGFSTALLSVDVGRTLFVGNDIGLRVGDNYGWQVRLADCWIVLNAETVSIRC